MAHIRLRCPVCGMLTWPSALDKDPPFEVKVQHSVGRSNGWGWKFTNTEVNEDILYDIYGALIDAIHRLKQDYGDVLDLELGGKEFETGETEEEIEGGEIYYLDEPEETESEEVYYIEDLEEDEESEDVYIPPKEVEESVEDEADVEETHAETKKKEEKRDEEKELFSIDEFLNGI